MSSEYTVPDPTSFSSWVQVAALLIIALTAVAIVYIRQSVGQNRQLLETTARIEANQEATATKLQAHLDVSEPLLTEYLTAKTASTTPTT